jgi:hypothetical protein
MSGISSGPSWPSGASDPTSEAADTAQAQPESLAGAISQAAAGPVSALQRMGQDIRTTVTAGVFDAKTALQNVTSVVVSAAHDLSKRLGLGTDPEVARLTRDVEDIRARLGSGTPTEDEIQQMRRDVGAAADRLTEINAAKGQQSLNQQSDFQKDLAEIHFAYLDGANGAPGALSALANASDADRAARARDVALDIAASNDERTATDKVNLLRASLSRVPNSAVQEQSLNAVEQALGTIPGGAIDAARFHDLAHQSSTISVHETPLPPSVAGTDASFPNHPVPGWSDSVRASVKAGLDDLEGQGQLFLDKAQAPPDGRPYEVAVKLDLNLGMEGPPTVSDPAHTFATVVELGERAKAKNLPVHFTVGDSSGVENLAIGVTSLDNAKRTGNYHAALKAGLTLAQENGDPGADAALAKLNDAEAKGYYAGGPGDPNPGGWGDVEKAASKYVKVVDYDKEGYTDVPNDQGPLGKSLFAWDHFSMAKPWVDADARVHVTRSLSDHTLLEKGKNQAMTGPTKGLIGLHAIDRRPFWYGAQLSGLDFAKSPFVLARAGSFAEVIGARYGQSVSDLLAGPLPDELRDQRTQADSAWQQFKDSGQPYFAFQVKLGNLERDVSAARAGGMSDRDAIEKTRAGIKGILGDIDGANPGLVPPFSDRFYSAAHETTRLVETLAGYERYLNPLPPSPGREFRGEDMARRIGLLTSLPDPSDLVITGDVKRGIVGGPDHYVHTLDVGETYVATSEAAVDAAATARTSDLLADASARGGMLEHASSINSTNPWDNNILNGAVQFGHAPMGPQEMKILGDSAKLDAHFAPWKQ